MKKIRVTFSNGETWEFPAGIIATNKASHYEKVGTVEFDTLRQQTLQNNDSLIEWLTNDMLWMDVKAFATLVSTNPIDYEDEFPNADFEIPKH